MTDLKQLAERVRDLPDVTCPLCGETGFDASGFSMHIFRWCEVERAINESFADRNSDIAAALLARAETDHGK